MISNLLTGLVCSQLGYERLLAQLAQVEFAATKSDYASGMMKQELRNYESISVTIDGGIEQAKAQIDQSKQNLVLAKRIRKNRMEYDVLAKIISAQPDRRRTTEKLDQLKAELADLDGSRRQMQRKLEMRRKDFAVLMRSIRELQSRLDDDVRPDGSDKDDDEDAKVVHVKTAEFRTASMDTEPIEDDEDDDVDGIGTDEIAVSIVTDVDDVEMVSPTEKSPITDRAGHPVSDGDE